MVAIVMWWKTFPHTMNRRWGRARGKKLPKGIVISTQRAIPGKMIPVTQFFLLAVYGNLTLVTPVVSVCHPQFFLLPMSCSASTPQFFLCDLVA